MQLRRRHFLTATAAFGALAGLQRSTQGAIQLAQINPVKVTTDASQTQAIAEEAYIFAYPMLENYKTMYFQAINTSSPAFRAPIGTFFRADSLADASDKDVVRTNNDTLYAGLRLDLSAEPWVLSVPANPEQRYYSIQLIDIYTHNYGYISQRTTGGRAAGHYLLAGPSWTNAKPSEIDQLFQSEGNLVFALGRTAVNGPSDLPQALAFAEQYQAMPLSQFLKKKVAPPASATGSPFLLVPGQSPVEPVRVAPAVPTTLFPPYDPTKATTPEFISIFNFLLGQVQIHPGETALIEKFGQIGIGPNRPFDLNGLSAEMQAAIAAGIASALQKINTATQTLGETRNGWQFITQAFGNRDRMQGRYLTRAAAAQYALYGHDAEEAIYPSTEVDAEGDSLDGSMQNYLLQFRKDEIPAAQAFWSITMYSFPDQLLVDNPIHRYSIGDRTTGLEYDADGGLTLYIQSESPGSDREVNWLPAPQGLFSLTIRIYLPEARALAADYRLPPIRKAITPT